MYLPASIKDAERVKRASESGVRFKNTSAGHKIKQWRRFLSESENKTALIKFITDEWQNDACKSMVGSKTLLVTCGQGCWRITKDHVSRVMELESTQEEADTRLILHAKHAADKGFRVVVIVCEDTDVFIMALSFSKDMHCDLYQRRSAGARTEYLDMRKLRLTLGDEMSEALIGLHAFTGCDTVSAFAGRGKIGPIKQLRKQQQLIDVFRNLGKSWDLSQEILDDLQAFTCCMYAPTTKTTKVNQLRYELFFAKRGEVDSGALPPCDDSLMQHIRRANYQAGIWRRCLVSKPDIPEPDGNGWTRAEDGSLEIDWLHRQPAPDAVLEFIACQCKRECKPGDCGCINNGFKCTYMCKLQTCGNMHQWEENDTNTIMEYDSDTDDDE